MPKDKKVVRHKVRGYTFYLKPLPRSVLLMALSDSDKPKAPVIEVTYADGSTGREINREDPQYRDASETWQAQYNSRLFRMCIVYGIDHVEDPHGAVASPTEQEQDTIRFVFGSELSHEDLMQYWYAEIIGDTDRGFMNLVLGQSEVTRAGVAADEHRFRPSDRRTRASRVDPDVPPEAEVEDEATV